jgi:NRAMP (natural resistance-associated macrophage protein)-like metal ion transporter
MSGPDAPFTPDASADVKQPRLPPLLKVMGPGLITGASDDDPSGIATYSQAGAAYGYQMGWALLFTWPLMCAIQEISARVGRVTGRGIAGNIKAHFPAPLVYALVGMLLVANVINIGADLGAMAAALQLVTGGGKTLVFVYVIGFGLASALLQIFARYSRYVSVLKWLTLVLFAYVGVVLVVHVPWLEVLKGLILPKIEFNAAYLTVVVALLGTTISPYLFFWQAEEEVEETKEHFGAKPLGRAPEQARSEFRRIRLDTYIGMAFSNIVALFIITTAAATLHAHGQTDIQSSAQAAEALRPIAGPFVFVVFALGIVGTGLLAIPVLAGSAAYALGETFGWHVGLARKAHRAKAFYGALAAAVAAGVIMNLTPIDPMKALFWSAVINGVVAVPVMVLLMIMGSNTQVMGGFKLPPVLKGVGWAATAAMAAAAVGMFATLSHS